MTEKIELTIDEVVDLVDRCWEIKKQKDALDKQKKTLNLELTELQTKVGIELERNEINSIKSPNCSFSYKDVQYFKVPQLETQKEEFFNYLKEKQVYGHLVSVGSQVLQSFCKSEIELKDEMGEYDFEIPGIELGDAQHKYSMRKRS